VGAKVRRIRHGCLHRLRVSGWRHKRTLGIQNHDTRERRLATSLQANLVSRSTELASSSEVRRLLEGGKLRCGQASRLDHSREQSDMAQMQLGVGTALAVNETGHLPSTPSHDGNPGHRSANQPGATPSTDKTVRGQRASFSTGLFGGSALSLLLARTCQKKK